MKNINNIPGIKVNELKKCACCGEGMMNNKPAPQLQFLIIDVRSMIIDVSAVQERYGMEMMMGGGQQGAVLASVMGPNADIAKELCQHQLFLCYNCLLFRPREVHLLQLLEDLNNTDSSEVINATEAEVNEDN